MFSFEKSHCLASADAIFGSPGASRGHRAPRPGAWARGGLAALALLAGGLTAPAATAETHEFKIPKAAVYTAINAYLAGVSVRLDNWGPFKAAGGGTWEVQDSYVRLPSGAKTPINLPRSNTIQTPTKRYNVYVDDFSTQTIDVQPDGQLIKVRIFFESAGNEIHIGCINRNQDEPCKAHAFKHTGDIDNAHVYIWFKPTYSGATVQFAPAKTDLDFDMHLDSKALDTVKNAADYFIDIKGKARKTLHDAVFAEFSKPAIRAKLSQDVNALLQNQLVSFLQPRLGSGAANFAKNNVKVTGVGEKGSDYVIAVSYPDIIGPDAVSVVSFAPKSKNLTAGCPINFGFDGSIAAKAKVSGQVWMVYEDGSTSKKMDWQMGRAGTATSTLVRTVAGTPGRKTNGWAMMVVSWKGSTGQTFQAVSSKATFSATCSTAQGGLKS